MDTKTIIYENYIFKFNMIEYQIKVNMTDNILMKIYEGTINETDVYVKPIKTIYNFTITKHESDIFWNILYNN